MNTATRIVTHQHVEEAANTIFTVPTHFGFGAAFLAILVLLSALTVVYLSDLNRRLFIQYQDTQATHNQLYVEWGKLLLEQSTWSTQARVQEIAQQRLGLELPATNDVVMIKKPV